MHGWRGAWRRASPDGWRVPCSWCALPRRKARLILRRNDDVFGQANSQLVLCLVGSVAYEDAQLSSKRRAPNDLDVDRRIQPELAQVAQLLGVLVVNAQNLCMLSILQVQQRAPTAYGDGPVLTGNGVAVGIDGWISEQAIDFILELFGDDVLQLIGLLVHLIPAIPKLACKVEFEQTMMPDQLHRLARAQFR